MLLIGGLGGWEIVIILLIVLIIFGPSKLPQMGQALGKAIKEFKKAGKELRSDITEPDDENEKDFVAARDIKDTSVSKEKDKKTQ